MNFIIIDLESNIDSTLEFLRESLSKINIGRAQTDIFDLVKVNCYDTIMPLSHVAIINVVDASKIVIQPHDKSLIKIIDKQIRDCNLNVSCSISGNVINVFFPLMTLDRRDSLMKMVNQYGEKAKVILREHRRNALSEANDIPSENDRTSLNKKIELLVSQTVDNIEKLTDDKNRKLKQLI